MACQGPTGLISLAGARNPRLTSCARLACLPCLPASSMPASAAAPWCRSPQSSWSRGGCRSAAAATCPPAPRWRRGPAWQRRCARWALPGCASLCWPSRCGQMGGRGRTRWQVRLMAVRVTVGAAGREGSHALAGALQGTGLGGAREGWLSRSENGGCKVGGLACTGGCAFWVGLGLRLREGYEWGLQDKKGGTHWRLRLFFLLWGVLDQRSKSEDHDKQGTVHWQPYLLDGAHSMRAGADARWECPLKARPGIPTPAIACPGLLSAGQPALQPPPSTLCTAHRLDLYCALPVHSNEQQPCLPLSYLLPYLPPPSLWPPLPF